MARPCIKWVGGKTQLLEVLSEHIRKTKGCYYEAFSGGLACFLRFSENPERFSRAVVGDNNAELINLYEVIKTNPDSLFAILETWLQMPDWCSESFYYKMRASEPVSLVERAARIIYLNKMCFNGLYRVNRAGKFNVPYGHPKKPPTLYTEENILAVSEALQRAEIRHGDFSTVIQDVQPGDVIYFDPPYVPLSKTSSFTAYSEAFNEESQRRLAQTFSNLVSQGVHCVLSNSSADLVRELYSQHQIFEVDAKRNINSDGSKRGSIKELVIVGAN